MMVHILAQQNSIGNNYLAELRDVGVQTDRMRFRRNLERIGELLAYEISKTLQYADKDVETPLGVAKTRVLAEQPVIATIIRAGIPMHQGVLNVFDQADAAFVAAYRKTKKSGAFEIRTEYLNTPNLDGKVLIVADTMLATGQSMVLACKELIGNFKIKELHIVSAIACEEGVAHVRAYLPKAKLWLGDVDAEMTSKSYIVPGLGDAGDLAYGEKNS
jgi:uracil phosphoribosyltransferase